MQDAQLQQHVQRQASQFCERIMQAMAPLEESSRREIRDSAMSGCLLYVSSAIEIASGPLPELNLLDLFVFMRLCRDAFESHWIPRLYGELGQEVLTALLKSEHDLADVLDLAFGEGRRSELEVLVDDWNMDNPGQFRVEGVRLDDFAHHAGRGARERSERARGLLSSIKSATQSADRALLLAERAIFLGNRMPFLLRLQVRLACREVTADIVASLVAIPAAVGTFARGAIASLSRRANLLQGR